MINLNNYEIWMLDYFDGKLTSDETSLLSAFLEEYPELNESLEDGNLPVLESDSIKYEHKDTLYNALSLDSDDMQIAALEGDLESCGMSDQNIELEDKNTNIYSKTILLVEEYSMDKSNLYAKKYDENDIDDLILGTLDGTISLQGMEWRDKHLSKEFVGKQSKILSSIQITPNNDITFPNKESLKKRPAVILYFKRAMAVAAMLAMVFYSVHLWQKNDKLLPFGILANNAVVTNNEDAIKEPKILATNTSPSSSEESIIQITGTTLNTNDQKKVKEPQKFPSIKQNKNTNDHYKYVVSNGLHAIQNKSDAYAVRLGDEKIPQKDLLLESKKVDVAQRLSSIPIKSIHNSGHMQRRPIKDNVNSEKVIITHKQKSSSFASELRIDIPKVFYKLAGVVNNAQEAYVSGKSHQRKVLDIKLGLFSFYRSSKNDE